MATVARLLGATLLVLAVTSGCGSAPDVTTLPAPSASPPPRPVLLVDEPTTASMAALGGGRLEVVGGCLGADGRVVVWPHGTRFVADDPLTVEVPGIGRVALGEQVSLGGGWIVEHTGGKVPDSPWHLNGGQRVPDSCLAHDVFLAGPYQSSPAVSPRP